MLLKMSLIPPSAGIDCINGFIPRFVFLFSLAFVATLIYIILDSPPFEQWFGRYIPDKEYMFATKVLLFFTLVYIADRILFPLRVQINICGLT